MQQKESKKIENGESAYREYNGWVMEKSKPRSTQAFSLWQLPGQPAVQPFSMHSACFMGHMRPLPAKAVSLCMAKTRL